MNYDHRKLVNFFEWCKKCRYTKTNPEEYPCTECVSHPVNIDSHKPVKWEEDNKKENK